MHNKNQKDLVNTNGVYLGDLLRVFKDFKKLILVTSITTTMLAYFYSLTLTPTYLATTLLVSVENNDKMSSIFSGLGGFAYSDGIPINEIRRKNTTPIAIFKSRKFIEAYIDEEKLLPLLFSERWDEERGVWKGNKPSLGSGYQRYKAIHADEILPRYIDRKSVV